MSCMANLVILCFHSIYSVDQITYSKKITRNWNWNKKQHSQSGLLARVKKSNLTIADAEKMTLNFLKKITNKEESPMCGNTICQDRRFLARLMPELESHFNYRNLDVTSIKITSQLWNPEVARSHSKNSNHLAMDDVYDSIHELRHYKKHLLIEK